MVVGGAHVAQRRGHNLHLRMLLHHLVDHPEEDARIELGFGGKLRAGDSQALLQVLLVAHQDVGVLHDAVQHGNGALLAAGDVP